MRFVRLDDCADFQISTHGREKHFGPGKNREIFLKSSGPYDLKPFSPTTSAPKLFHRPTPHPKTRKTSEMVEVHPIGQGTELN